MKEMQALKALAEYTFKFRVQRADKGEATVVISAGRMIPENRAHVGNDKAYDLAGNFSNILGELRGDVAAIPLLISPQQDAQEARLSRIETKRCSSPTRQTTSSRYTRSRYTRTSSRYTSSRYTRLTYVAGTHDLLLQQVAGTHDLHT